MRSLGSIERMVNIEATYETPEILDIASTDRFQDASKQVTWEVPFGQYTVM